MSEYDDKAMHDNIEAQLDMAVEAADDIGFDDEVSNDTEMGANEEGEVNPVEQAAPQGDESNTGQVGGTEPVQQAQPAPQSADSTATGQNETGDLVNAAGEVVATAGAERRVYERSNKIQQENIETTRRMADMQKQFDDNNSFANQPKNLGLTNDESLIGMQLMQQLKSDPVAAARQILQTAVSKGYNVQDIIGTAHGANSAVDMGAIEQMIASKLAPITQREEQFQQQQDQQQSNENAKRQFISKHEFSDIHLDPITNLLQNNPNMSPEQAYYEVKTYALSNGYDFTQPLGEQVLARNAGGNNQQTNQPNRGMPNGNSSSNVVTQAPAQANGDDDWDAIVRNSMAESGMQI
jgi:hypothetical protein